jgi:hypothetical protein
MRYWIVVEERQNGEVNGTDKRFKDRREANREILELMVDKPYAKFRAVAVDDSGNVLPHQPIAQ